MNKFDNFVMLTICEVSFKQFKKSNYTSFPNYCFGLGYAIRGGNPSSRERVDLSEVAIMLEKIYGFTFDESGQYIALFFNLDVTRFTDFESIVRGTMEFYPMSLN